MLNTNHFIRLALVVCVSADAAPVLYENARIIVDPRRVPMENAAMLVDNGRIVRVAKKGQLKAANRVDLTGKTIVPAFVDPHIHLGYQKGTTFLGTNVTLENAADQLNRYAYAGVSAVMSLGTDPGDLPYQIRAQQASGKMSGAQLFTAGRGFAAPNAGPGNTEMRAVPYGVTNQSEARRLVRDEIAHQVNIIKIWVDDRNGTVKKLEPALSRAIIDEAHKRGVRVIAHVYYLEDAKQLAEMGVDAFAHLVRDQEMDDATVALIRQRKIFNMPNMGIAESRTTSTPPPWLDEPLFRVVTPAALIERVRASYRGQSVENTRQAYAIMQRNLMKLHKAGALIGFGADSGAVPDYFHAFTTHRELEVMTNAGLSPAEALTTVTVSSAAFLKLADRGTLEAGKRADFIVLDANPLDNIANTRQIHSVYFKGQMLDRAALAKSF